MLDTLNARPVNSGVIRAWKQRPETRQIRISARARGAALRRSNKGFDPTGMSMPLIENLSVMQLSPGGSIPALGGYVEGLI
jgi:hypothetical protein